jgi:hypothetical protein
MVRLHTTQKAGNLSGRELLCVAIHPGGGSAVAGSGHTGYSTPNELHEKHIFDGTCNGLVIEIPFQ